MTHFLWFRHGEPRAYCTGPMPCQAFGHSSVELTWDEALVNCQRCVDHLRRRRRFARAS